MQPELMDALKSKRGVIEEICKVSGVAGVSIAVIDQGETIWQTNFGYRDLENEKPVTSDTIFPIASMTKSFTGACINRLRQEGKLSLDDLIAKRLPEATSQDDTIATTATIADLLGHRTGLQAANNMWLGAQGELLFNRDQTATAFSHLKPQVSLRSGFFYNNIGYATLGEIIIKLTGQPYYVYLKKSILEPLNMTRTFVSRDGETPENLSLAASGVMGASGGLLSTANDLTKYYKALMKSWQAQSNLRGNDIVAEPNSPMFDQVAWLFAPLQIMEMPTVREKSYAAGWARSQLPTTVGDIGVNGGLVEQMPLLATGIDSRLALWHQGSLVGATSFVMMLPETESAVVVLTNTMALNDAADWIGQLLVETLLDAPIRNDYVALASLSADRALKKYEELTQNVNEGRESDGIIRDLRDYVGRYVGFGGIFHIDVVNSEKGLEILFQGRESQKYLLKHHHQDKFTWFMTWNEQVKRARWIITNPAFYFISFQAEQGKVTALNWVHDASIPEGESFFKA
ncbi:hypothetical protein AK830_g1344 [Neonectria ditissima]|uniref:Beta-lactamase-related domain-containing protein n=1 Tax=Neonectria ditissima TaxID=78410 RepID=A0A0P7BUK6_9HYPO|nr:hypothetical protein AK830_g1344 [Neonectria ditissima]